MGSRLAWYRQGGLLFLFLLFLTVKVFQAWWLVVIVHVLGRFGIKMWVGILIYISEMMISDISFCKGDFVKIDAGPNMMMSLLIRYAHMPFYFRFSFAFSTLSIHHYAPPLWCNHMTITLTSSDQSRLFYGHMIHNSHVFTSILSISNMSPPAVRPIMSSCTVRSGTFYNFTLCSYSCLPFVFNLPVFYLSLRTSSEKSLTIAYTSFPQNWDLALMPHTISHLFHTILHHIALPQFHCLYLPRHTWRQSLAPRAP